MNQALFLKMETNNEKTDKKTSCENRKKKMYY